MSIMQTLFGQRQQQPAQQQQAQQQNPNPHIASNQTIPNGNEPGANPNPAGEKTQSPTDKFKDLWDTSNQQQPDNQPNFKLNQEQLGKVTGGMDFTKSLSRDDMAAIANGGEGAIAALGNVLNAFGREVFGASAQFSSHMTESGYNSASKIIDNGLPGAIKRQMTEQQMYSSNPKLKDTALQPLVSAMQSQFAAKHPNASPQEISDLVSEYFGTVVTGAFAKDEPAAQQKQNQGTDFASFLG